MDDQWEMATMKVKSIKLFLLRKLFGSINPNVKNGFYTDSHHADPPQLIAKNSMRNGGNLHTVALNFEIAWCPFACQN